MGWGGEKGEVGSIAGSWFYIRDTLLCKTRWDDRRPRFPPHPADPSSESLPRMHSRAKERNNSALSSRFSSVIYPDFEHGFRAFQWFPAAFSSNGCIYIKDHDDVLSSNFRTEKFVYLSCKFLLFDIITMKLQPSHFVRVLLRDISRFRMWISRFPMISNRVLFEWRCIYIYIKRITMMYHQIYPVNFFYSILLQFLRSAKGKKNVILVLWRVVKG